MSTCAECSNPIPEKGPIPHAVGTYRCATCARLAACDACRSVFDRAALSVTFWGALCGPCKVRNEARAEAARGTSVTAHGWLDRAGPLTILRLVLAMLGLLVFLGRVACS